MPTTTRRAALESLAQARRLFIRVRAARTSLEECLTTYCTEREVASRARTAAEAALQLLEALRGCAREGEAVACSLEDKDMAEQAERLRRLCGELRAAASALEPLLRDVVEGRRSISRSLRLVREALEAVERLESLVDEYEELARTAVR